jgi:hypothetical protein
MTETAQQFVEILKILLTIGSILVAASALLQNLERARRELAVNLIYSWANDTDWATKRAISIAMELGGTIIQQINDMESSSIRAEHYAGVVSILRAGFPEEELPPPPSNGKPEFQITPEHSAFIRFQWIRWLNRLEGTLAAWQQSAADPELMEKEFKLLVQGTTAEVRVLKPVRGDDLPVINAFYDEVGGTGQIKRRRRLGVFPFNR